MTLGWTRWGLIALALAGADVAAAGTSVPNQGALLRLGGETPVEMPLKRTDVTASLSADASHTKVVQVFRNPYPKPLEAVYVFPLPDGAAVTGLTLRIGGRAVRGEVRRRGEVGAAYARAREEGALVASLEQERPNIFTQSVANIPPGGEVSVELVYDVPLRYDGGEHEFSFPMVVAPRHIPGRPDGRPVTGTGTAPNTDRVPDASRISPPILPPGLRSGRDITLRVVIDAGKRPATITSPSHAIKRRDLEGGRVEVSIAAGDRIANKDFVLRYRLASSDEAEVVVVSHRDDRGGFFSLLLEPPRSIGDILPREVVLVLDASGSMRGASQRLMQDFAKGVLGALRPGDSIALVRASDGTSPLGKRPVVATRKNVQRATSLVERLVAGGGGSGLVGLRAALALPRQSKGLRIVVFMSDGLTGNEVELLSAVGKQVGDDVRVFSVGFGSSANRYLIERMAEIGRGASAVVLPGESPGQAIAAFLNRLRSPLLKNVEILFDGLDVFDVSPDAQPDLFAGQPVRVVGRYGKAGSGSIVIRATAGDRRIELRRAVTLSKTPDNPALPVLWARDHIRRLMSRWLGKPPADARARIESLALEFSLVTAYTSILAVGDEVAQPGGGRIKVPVPIDLAADLEREATLDDRDAEAKEESAAAEPEGDSVKNAPAPPPAMERGQSFTGTSGTIALTESDEGGRPGGNIHLSGGLTLGLSQNGGEPHGHFSLGVDLGLGKSWGLSHGIVVAGPLGEPRKLAGALVIEGLALLPQSSPITLRVGGGPALVQDEGFGLLGTATLRLSLPRLSRVGLTVTYDRIVVFGDPDVNGVGFGLHLIY